MKKRTHCILCGKKLEEYAHHMCDECLYEGDDQL